ncbi:MAG: membrane protein insertase YidC [Pseudomonadota bacterium]
MDNQRLIVWAFFGLMLWLTWQAWQRDYAPAPPPAAVQQEAAPTEEAPAALPELAPPPGADIPAADSALPDLPGDPAEVPDAGTTVSVVTDVARYEISTRGGSIVSATMLNYPVAKDQPDTLVQLLSTDPVNVGVLRTGLRSNSASPDHEAVFTAAATSYELGQSDELRVPLSWSDASGVSVTKEYVFKRGEYAVLLEQTVSNGSAEAWTADHYSQIVRRSYKQERSMFDVGSYSFDGPLFFDGKKAEKLDRKDLAEVPFTFTGPNAYIAAIQQHFLVAMLPTPDAPYVYQAAVSGNRMTASAVGARQTVAAGESYTFQRTFFIGPKLQRQLEAIEPKLKLTVDYGFLTILSQPMFWLLDWIHKFVGNWGWSIILVTLVIKLAFYKLTETSGRSMAKMRNLQPRMKALQDRYKDDRQALSQQMMDLYKREKVNPAAGCLPILVQMPFFLAFYWVLVESVEMRQAPFALWITDLSSRDPYFILPLVMGAAMFLQQRLNPAPTDPVQARVMQIMPIMFTGFFAFFPAGLVLYWVTNTVLSIAQQWKINKVVEQEAKDKPHGKKSKSDDD